MATSGVPRLWVHLLRQLHALRGRGLVMIGLSVALITFVLEYAAFWSGRLLSVSFGLASFLTLAVWSRVAASILIGVAAQLGVVWS